MSDLNYDQIQQIYDEALNYKRSTEPWIADEYHQQAAAAQVRLQWFHGEVQRLLDATGDPVRNRSSVFDRLCLDGDFQQRLIALRGYLLAQGLITIEQADQVQLIPPRLPEEQRAMEEGYRESLQLQEWVNDILANVTDRTVALNIYANMGNDPRSTKKLAQFVDDLQRAGQLSHAYQFTRQSGRVVEAVKEVGQRIRGAFWEGDE